MNNPQPGVDFINPYINVAPENIKRTNTEIDVNDWNLLRSVRVKQGTFTTANNLLIWKLCNECRKRGLTDMSRHQEFEQFVAGLHLVPNDEYQALSRGVLNSPTDGTSRDDNGQSVAPATQGKGGGDTKPAARSARVYQTEGRDKKHRAGRAKGK